jgi:N-acetyl-gamma-glutamyl-phosphate reductase
LVKAGLIAPETVVINAQSGVSGAGRGLALGTHFCETQGSMKAYKVANHRHTPEIEQGLATLGGLKQPPAISFTPHLVPLNRGMHVTTTATLTDVTIGWHAVQSVYQSVYAHAPFVRLCGEGESPESNWVKGTNFCDIAWAIDPRTNRIVLTSVIDNLMKGAAGQAVHNMNWLFGLPETMGLLLPALMPA